MEVSFLLGESFMQFKWRTFADCEVLYPVGRCLDPALISCCFLTESWVSITWNHLSSKWFALPTFRLMATLSPWFKIHPASPNKVSLSSYFLLPSRQFHFLLWAPQQIHNLPHYVLPLRISFISYVLSFSNRKCELLGPSLIQPISPALSIYYLEF